MLTKKVWFVAPGLGLILMAVLSATPAMAISERAGAAARQRSATAAPHGTAPLVVPGGNGLIVFQSDRVGNGKTQIFTIDNDGVGPAVQLTKHNQESAEPTWSPDGTGVAYTNCCPGNTSKEEVYTVNANGKGRLRLTNNSSSDLSPTWSPDETRIAFVSKRDGNNEIYVMNADGSNQIDETNNSHVDKNPAWSPDGKKI